MTRSVKPTQTNAETFEMTDKSDHKLHIERLEKLRDLRRKVMDLPPENAVDAILEASQPLPLVHSFTEQDLSLLMHAVGPDDFLPVLSMASDRQWDHILDMETWVGDRVNIPAVTTWLERFLLTDASRLWRLMIKDNGEFIAFYLFKNIEVRIREHDEDPSDFGDGYFTLDDVFYIRLHDLPVTGESGKELKEQRDVVVSRLIEQLAAMDHEVYQKMLLEAAAVIPAETEEEVYRMRTIRLSEKGFLPFEEAVGIYSPVRPEAVKKMAAKHRLPVDDAVEGALAAPLYSGGLLKEDNEFSRALAHVDEASLLLQIQTEFAALCNQLIAADRVIIREREELAGIVRKACAYISLGLAVLSEEGPDDTDGSGPQEHAGIISRYPLSAIFRAGYTMALDLKSKAGKWVEKSWFKNARLPLTFWEEGFMGILGGLLIKKPLFFDNYRTGVIYREFTSLEEIEETAGQLATIIGFDALFTLMAPDLAETQGSVTYRPLILTLFARHFCGLPVVFRPIPFNDFRRFFAAIWSESETGRIREETKTAFLTFLSEQTELTAHEISERLGHGLTTLFGEVENEYGPVSAKDLDPRFIDLFLIETAD